MAKPTKEVLDQFCFSLLRSQVGNLEEGKNGGPWVNLYQRAVTTRGVRSGKGRAENEPWCAAFVQWVIMLAERAYGVKSRVVGSELSTAIFDKSPHELRLKAPEPGALVIWQRKGTIFGHTEWILGVNPDGTLHTIGGNTGPDAGPDVVDQGDGVYEKLRVDPKGTSKKPVLGFIKVWE
jgi:hypothetical protein